MEPARRRLAALAATGPGRMGGAVEYWLGVCEASLDHPDAALRAFARVPDGFPFDANGACLEARANLAHGHLRAAERRLERMLARGGPDLGPTRTLLRHIYEIEVRFDDARALVRASLADAAAPIRVLRELSNFDLERVPADGLRAAWRRPAGWPPRRIASGWAWGGSRSWPADGTRRRAGSGVASTSPMRRSGDPGWNGLAAPAAPRRPSAQRSSSATTSLRKSNWRCVPGSRSGAATTPRRSVPWRLGSASSRRRRGRSSASPSWPIAPAGPIAWPS